MEMDDNYSVIIMEIDDNYSVISQYTILDTKFYTIEISESREFLHLGIYVNKKVRFDENIVIIPISKFIVNKKVSFDENIIIIPLIKNDNKSKKWIYLVYNFILKYLCIR